MQKRCAGLYARLLACLPHSFREQFTAEMEGVFARRMGAASSQGRASALHVFGGELLALPGLWLLAFRRERRAVSMNTTRYDDSHSDGPATWAASLAAALPLAVFLLLHLLFAAQGLASLGNVRLLGRSLWASVLRVSVEPSLFFYLFVLAGCLVAWVKRFPRWSYSYLGWLFTVLLFSAGAIRPRDEYFYVSWLPFFAALLLTLLLTRSLAPLRAMWRGWRQDWTQASFALFALLEFLVLAGFDEMPGPRGAKSTWEAVALALLVAGAVAYMRARGQAGRAAALVAGAALSGGACLFSTSYYWQTYPKPDFPVAAGSAAIGQGLLLLGVWIIALLFPGLVSAVVRRIFPGQSNG